jgi:polysaccharide export outer membrane protein
MAVLPGCWTGPPSYNYRGEPDPSKVQYVLGPGDMVEIRQWKNADVSGRLRVMPDGTITVPLLGQVMAAGLTVQALRDKLSAGLSRYINQTPEMQSLTISVDEFQGDAVSVLGEVNQPGHYQPGHYVTVLEALALAHGLTPYARGERIIIIRTIAGEQRRIPLSYPLLAEGKRPDMNLLLLRGDVIVVP